MIKNLNFISKINALVFVMDSDIKMKNGKIFGETNIKYLENNSIKVNTDGTYSKDTLILNSNISHKDTNSDINSDYTLSLDLKNTDKNYYNIDLKGKTLMNGKEFIDMNTNINGNYTNIFGESVPKINIPTDFIEVR